MKTSHLLVSAVVASLPLATMGFAVPAAIHANESPVVSQYLEHYKVLRTDVPLPIKVVAPAGLPDNYIPTTFNVTMLIDREGRPKNIEIDPKATAEVSKILMSALTQWRFSPALKDGVPVEKLVILPLRVS